MQLHCAWKVLFLANGPGLMACASFLIHAFLCNGSRAASDPPPSPLTTPSSPPAGGAHASAAGAGFHAVAYDEKGGEVQFEIYQAAGSLKSVLHGSKAPTCDDDDHCMVCQEGCKHLRVFGISAGAPVVFNFSLIVKALNDEAVVYSAPFEGHKGIDLGGIKDTYSQKFNKVVVKVKTWG